MKYEDFRTGLTFQDVYELIKQEVDAKYQRGEYDFQLKGASARRAVLGRWHELKREAWEYYLEETGGKGGGGFFERFHTTRAVNAAVRDAVREAALAEGLPF